MKESGLFCISISKGVYKSALICQKNNLSLFIFFFRIPLSSLINQHLNVLANKFPKVKFVKSLASLCIPNYPDHNLPTLFIYQSGDLKQQLIGPSFFNPALKQDGIHIHFVHLNVQNKFSSLYLIETNDY